MCFDRPECIEWVQFVLQNCKILHSVWDLCDKNSASYYCFTSDAMYKWYWRLVYTRQNLLTRFCKVNLSNTKILARFFLPGLINLINRLSLPFLQKAQLTDNEISNILPCLSYFSVNIEHFLIHSNMPLSYKQ